MTVNIASSLQEGRKKLQKLSKVMVSGKMLTKINSANWSTIAKCAFC